jgi:chemotaxis protein MotB
LGKALFIPDRLLKRIGVGLSRKKEKHEEEGGSERWLVSYADFITLLFAFFTTLYAISTVDAQKMGKMVTSMRASFDSTVFDQGSKTLSLSKGTGGTDSSSSVIPSRALPNSIQVANKTIKDWGATKTVSRKPVLSGGQSLGGLQRNVVTLLGTAVLNNGKVRTYLEPRGLIISLGENGIFDSGSDQIKPEGKALLDTIATGLTSMGNYIRIEGHTDNVPIRNSRFPSNWELSTARATAVVSQLIVKFGLRPDLISAAGYAEYRPAASNDTEEGRARNRRVDIIVLNPATAGGEPQ